MKPSQEPSGASQSSRIKVLAFSPRYLPLQGGAEYGLFELYGRLAKSCDLALYTPLYDNHGMAPDDYYGQEPFVVRRYRRYPRILARWADGEGPMAKLLSALGILVGAWALVRAYVRERPDVVHMNYLFSSAIPILLFRAFRIKAPIILSLIGRPDVPRNENPSYRRWPGLYARVLDSCSKVIYQTEFMVGSHRDDRKFVRIPYGVTADRFAASPDRNKVLSAHPQLRGKRILATLSRLAQNKRVDMVIRAFARVRPHHEGTLLAVIGSGPEEENLRTLARELGCAGQVFFTGYVAEDLLPSWLGLAEVFLFASTSETFGIVLAQAMAAGLPIVATATSCIPDVVVDGVNGFLAGDSVESLADKIDELLRRPDEAKRFGDSNREQARQQYDWNVVATDYLRLFAAAAERESGPKEAELRT